MLADPFFLALKAGLATLVALALDRLTGNPDHLSAAFVAVLCAAPTVLIGLRRAALQLLGSLVGGVLGTVVVLGGVPPLVGVPAAVALSVWVMLRRAPLAYPVAAFSVLTVGLIPRGTPSETLLVRLVAVASAAVAGTVVNLVVSGFSYRNVFERRLRRAEAAVLARLARSGEGAGALQPGFQLLAALDEELSAALAELQARRSVQTRARLEALRGAVESLRVTLHLACDLHYGASADAAQVFAWLRAPDAPPPAVGAPTAAVAARIAEALRSVRQVLDAAGAAAPARRAG